MQFDGGLQTTLTKLYRVRVFIEEEAFDDLVPLTSEEKSTDRKPSMKNAKQCISFENDIIHKKRNLGFLQYSE